MKTIRDSNKTSRDIKSAHEVGKYIIASKSIYQPFCSANGGYYAQEVYRTNGTMTRPGRFFHMTGDQVNHLLGTNLLNNL